MICLMSNSSKESSLYENYRWSNSSIISNLY